MQLRLVLTFIFKQRCEILTDLLQLMIWYEIDLWYELLGLEQQS
jgi:hypothetical protein